MWVVSANHHFGLVRDRESVSVPAGRQQLPGYRQRYPRTQQHALGPQSTGLAPPFGGSVWPHGTRPRTRQESGGRGRDDIWWKDRRKAQI